MRDCAVEGGAGYRVHTVAGSWFRFRARPTEEPRLEANISFHDTILPSRCDGWPPQSLYKSNARAGASTSRKNRMPGALQDSALYSLFALDFLYVRQTVAMTRTLGPRLNLSLLLEWNSCPFYHHGNLSGLSFHFSALNVTCHVMMNCSTCSFNRFLVLLIVPFSRPWKSPLLWNIHSSHVWLYSLASNKGIFCGMSNSRVQVENGQANDFLSIWSLWSLPSSLFFKIDFLLGNVNCYYYFALKTSSLKTLLLLLCIPLLTS